ncbi:MAG: T9SS type A sorting domain-containing protein, partial [Bacteroidota bacterium]
VFAQQQKEPFSTEFSFIKNQGQFDGRSWLQDQPEYCIDYYDAYIFFDQGGITYRFDKMIKNPAHTGKSYDSPKRTNVSELIHVQWIGANPDVEIVACDECTAYYSFAVKNPKTGEVYNLNHVKGYKKLVYQNLYDNIDIIFEIHPVNGVKYSFIAHPGADISQIQMQYSMDMTKTGSEKIDYYQDDAGQIQIRTFLGEITEHNPSTYYSENKQEVSSVFHFENNILSFEIPNADPTKEITIDPWIESPSFTNSNAVWEVETDALGNVYVIGGESPMKLNKYDSAGNFKWSYTTPWDTTNVWLGTLKTGLNGTSYITSGTMPEIEKIDSSGTMLIHETGFNGNCEYWGITFSPDSTKLIVGGTFNVSVMNFVYYAAIYYMDIDSCNILYYKTLDSVNISAGPGFLYPIEVRSITSSKSGHSVFLTHNKVGLMSSCEYDTSIYQLDNNHHMFYKTENFLPAAQNGGGLKAIAASDEYIYIHGGDTIYKRLLSDGATVDSVVLSGGNSNYTPIVGGKVLWNSGLDVDDCGNVYAGSGDRVVKFDADLNIIEEDTVGFTVYDVDVNVNGEVIAIGAQGDNQQTNRFGKIQSLNMSACSQYLPDPCNAEICAPDTVCLDDPPFNLSTWDQGGYFSGPGIIDNLTGLFDPGVAGLGTHVIQFISYCDTGAVSIVVDNCIISFEKIKTDPGICIYPNPTTGIISIEAENIVKIEVTDVKGKYLLMVTTQKKIDLSGYRPGVYFVKVITNRGIATEKVVVEK